MIVVVDGPSAAGKTTWAAAHGGRSLVPEGIETASRPHGRELSTQPSSALSTSPRQKIT